MPSNMDMTEDDALSTAIILDKDGNEIHIGDDVSKGESSEKSKGDDEPESSVEDDGDKNQQDNS